MRDGSFSTSSFFAVIFPDTGEYTSLADLTLSKAPHSPKLKKIIIYVLIHVGYDVNYTRKQCLNYWVTAMKVDQFGYSEWRLTVLLQVELLQLSI